MTHRIHSTVACLVGAGAALLLGGCQAATVVKVTPSPSASATTSPTAGYDRRYGNGPVAAADGFRLQRQLIARGEYWEVSVSTEPASAQAAGTADAAALAAARAAARQATLTIATEVVSTIRALVARGRAGQQAYCAELLDQLRALGYTGLDSARVEVYFSERDRHAELTWTPSGATAYTVFDNDLGGDLDRLPGGTTPFPAPPTP